MTELMDDLSPMAIIERLVNEREEWPDAAVLEELRNLPPLSDETAYLDEDGDWSDIYLFVALADICALRRCRPAVVMLLERASFGDPGETMRDIRHNLEAIANFDWEFLADACLETLNSERAGTRLWSIEQLGVLRLERTLEAIRGKLDDPEDEVRAAAEGAIERIEASR